MDQAVLAEEITGILSGHAAWQKAPDGRILVDSLADLVMAVLDLAEEKARADHALRREQGIAAARERGVRFGRKAKPLPKNFASAVELWRKGALNLSEAARVCGMARSTFRYQAGQTQKGAGKGA